MNKKKLKARFIGPKVDKRPTHRHHDLTIGKIYDGYLNDWDEFIIFSDDVDEESYLNRDERVIVEDHDDTTHIHKRVYNRKRYYAIIK